MDTNLSLYLAFKAFYLSRLRDTERMKLISSFYELILQQFEKTSLSSLLEASVSAKGASMILFVPKKFV